MVYEEPFKVLQREPKYYTIDKNETNNNVSIDRPKAVYLDGKPNNVDFPTVHPNDVAL